jgi:asparagine synthase (glutamine-hydrolysing)
MCGIITITGNTVGQIKDSVINDMLSTLALRGPDSQKFLRFDNCIVGQTRLSIIDLSTGNQPMRDNAKPITIVFNGEIYNYKELRKELEGKKHHFATHSDTEVILKSYIEYGKDCPKHLDGMFAFTIWNEETQELFIARDRFGKKPLYYTINSNTLYIASEIKALEKAGIKGKIDFSAIDNYLALMYIPPWKSIYENIHVLPPAHQALFKNGKIETESYWQLQDKPFDVSYEEAKKKIKELFNDAVRKRMVADVEIGSFLSGGVDSTLVTAYAQKFSNRPIKTFALGYEELINELPFAKEASEKIKTDHHTLQAKNNSTEELKKVIEYMDEPHSDSSDFPQHLLSELTSSKVKVALSGDGADELFLGYGWYTKYWNVQKHIQLKNALFSNPFKEHLKLISVFSKSDRKKLWKNPSFVNNDLMTREVEKMRSNGIKKINLFDLTTYLPGQLLTKIDRTGMMHSLEVRSPFLDHKLAEYVYNMPLKWKNDGANGKIILKDILTEIMPEKFVYRRKQGFGAPVRIWLKTEEMKNVVYKNLDDKSMISGFLKEKEVKKILDDFYIRNDNEVYYKIWSLLCLELWLKTKI